MNQELVTYIVLGSIQRLKNLKIPSSSKMEEFLLGNFDKKSPIEKSIDTLVSNARGNLIVLLPPSSLPNKRSKDLLKKISMIDQSTWGWFKFNENNNDIIKNLKKISSSIRSIPNLEQGIFFTKRLYFSVGGIGSFGPSPFKEISKRFYSRIDPQNPLPALIIRTKNLNIF
ncbi:MAG: hypothetical protein CMD46_05110 [Gammaproteobacteria bacterium]|nr:hypothetical protein [Gammaproteobacteria bacterium]